MDVQDRVTLVDYRAVNSNIRLRFLVSFLTALSGLASGDDMKTIWCCLHSGASKTEGHKGKYFCPWSGFLLTIKSTKYPFVFVEKALNCLSVYFIFFFFLL